MSKAWRGVARARGRWIGRKDAIVADSRGLAPLEARRILAERAQTLRGAMLAGYWVGVAEINPDWAMASFEEATEFHL